MEVRRLFNGGCGPLWALCALVAVLWAGSYRSVAHARSPVAVGGTRWECISYRGLLSVVRVENHPTAERAAVLIRPDNTKLAACWDERFSRGSIGGFSADDTQIWIPAADGQIVARRLSAINFPYWLLLSLAALAPAHGAYVIVRAYRRTTHNRCGECGYDLGDGACCQACAARAAVVGATHRLRLVRPAT